MKNLFKGLVLTGVAATSFAFFASCSSSDDVAGGVTDIGNTIATDSTVFAGKVIDFEGRGIVAARVVAFRDDGVSRLDSTETISDSLGNFELKFASDNLHNVIYAESDSLQGLLGVLKASDTLGAFVQIGKTRTLTGSIEGKTSGYVRIEGTSLEAALDSNGAFAFDAMPPGTDLQLVYVQGDSSVGTFTFTPNNSNDSIELPPFDIIDKGVLTSTDLHSGISFGVSFTEPLEIKRSEVITKHLEMNGSENVYDNDSTVAESVDYVEGPHGNGSNIKAILLKPGQFIELDSVDITDGDFTISLWTKWNGPNGNHQVLVSERAYWSDSTSKFQWHFENTEGMFTVMKSMPKVPEAITFGDSSIVPVGKWTFLALVSKDHQITMYVNGEQVGETQTFIPNKLEKTVPFRIGGDEISTETWNGALDEVLIENVARSKEWVKEKFLHTFTHF